MSQNSDTPQKREHLATRLGFLLVSAGCAIGLGNIWRFLILLESMVVLPL
jgi:NSS family neurotransmitter:Na+ symporter